MANRPTLAAVESMLALISWRNCQPSVANWFAALDSDELYLSVLVIGEMQRGVDRVRRRDARGADALDRWLGNITALYAERILPVTLPIARLWGSFGVPDPVPTVHGLLAATAMHHELVLATRNVRRVGDRGRFRESVRRRRVSSTARWRRLFEFSVGR